MIYLVRVGESIDRAVQGLAVMIEQLPIVGIKLKDLSNQIRYVRKTELIYGLARSVTARLILIAGIKRISATTSN